jgi:hypothetical protein
VDEWLTKACDALAAASALPVSEFELDSETETTLLDLARIAAHESEARTNAPLICYLTGLASGKSGKSVAELQHALRNLG